jgi:hypothetical protein
MNAKVITATMNDQHQVDVEVEQACDRPEHLALQLGCRLEQPVDAR